MSKYPPAARSKMPKMLMTPEDLKRTFFNSLLAIILISLVSIYLLMSGDYPTSTDGVSTIKVVLQILRACAYVYWWGIALINLRYDAHRYYHITDYVAIVGTIMSVTSMLIAICYLMGHPLTHLKNCINKPVVTTVTGVSIYLIWTMYRSWSQDHATARLDYENWQTYQQISHTDISFMDLYIAVTQPPL